MGFFIVVGGKLGLIRTRCGRAGHLGLSGTFGGGGERLLTARLPGSSVAGCRLQVQLRYRRNHNSTRVPSATEPPHTVSSGCHTTPHGSFIDNAAMRALGQVRARHAARIIFPIPDADPRPRNSLNNVDTARGLTAAASKAGCNNTADNSQAGPVTPPLFQHDDD